MGFVEFQTSTYLLVLLSYTCQSRVSFQKLTSTILINVEPLNLAIRKEYNLNNVKEVKVTDDFLTLDRDTIGCQNDESINDCKTGEYVDSLMRLCKCLPYPIIDFKKVYKYKTRLRSPVSSSSSVSM